MLYLSMDTYLGNTFIAFVNVASLQRARSSKLSISCGKAIEKIPVT